MSNQISPKNTPPKLKYVRPRRWVRFSSPPESREKKKRITQAHVVGIIILAILSATILGIGIGLTINRSKNGNVPRRSSTVKQLDSSSRQSGTTGAGRENNGSLSSVR